MSEVPNTAAAPMPRGDKDMGAMAGAETKVRGRKRRKVSYLTINKIDVVDYKEVNILKRFINDRGKMLPARQTGNTAKQQRMIARAVRRARELALLPFVVTEMGPDRREFGGRERRPYREGGYRGDRGDRGNEGPREPRTEAPREAAESAPAAAPAPAAE